MKLVEYASSRDNNFNLVRLIAAALVLYSHSYPIFLGSGNPDPLKRLTGMTFGSLAVDIFFVTSGFLIAGSYFSRQHLGSFIWARFLRIFPALWVALLLTVLLIGLSISNSEFFKFFLHPETAEYLLQNALLLFGLQWDLPGAFANNPYPLAVNGSLWTLPWELKMYILLAFLALSCSLLGRYMKRLTAKGVIPTITLLAMLVSIFNDTFAFAEGRGLHLFCMFFLGSSLYLHRDKIDFKLSVFAGSVVVLILGVFFESLFYIFYLITLPYIVLYLAYVPGGLIRRFNSFGDYSYGVYIYAFPVQQAFVWAYPDLGFGLLTVSSFLVTLVFALFSWHLVEKPALALKGHYDLLERALRLILTKRKMFSEGS